MNAIDARVALDVLECLQLIAREGLAPAAAQGALPHVPETRPGLALNLIWDDARDGCGRHYDVLMSLPEGGTVSLSWCPPVNVPWPLRGARRFGDADLLRVDDVVLTVGEAIGRIDMMLADRSLSTRLVNACLARAELARHPVEVSQAELQRTMDAFRRTHRLHSVQACREWMARRGLDPAQFEALIADHAAVAALRRRVTADAIPVFFETHPAAFDRATVAVIDCHDAALAASLREALACGRMHFLEAAQAAHTAAVARGEADAPLLHSLQRGLAPEPWVQAVFEAGAGSWIGPLERDGRFRLANALALAPARLDEATREAVASLVFARWLDERRAAARIEWLWHEPGARDGDWLSARPS
jgi:putative peptide maturation system protein